jgi:dTDP-4-amino-4,6-dideoxygalactose transaminase
MDGGELELIREAFASNYIAPLGPMVDAFESEFASYTGIPHCVALASGTAAMHLVLRELGVGPGDEVLASTQTFIGSVSPVTFLGAIPVFIDSDEQTWNMDPNLLANELADCARRGKLPKVIIPTDLYGQCCDLPRLTAICDSYEVPIVCDSAEAMGAFYQVTASPDHGTTGSLKADLRPLISGNSPQLSTLNPQPGYRHSGHGARAAIFSFNGNKIMTTSGGGMLASHDAKLIEHARKLSQQARDPAPHYEHTEIGYNYRMSNILAAIGRGQLRRLDDRVAAKRRIFEHYRQLLGSLPGITFMPEAAKGRSNRWLTVILIDEAEFGATPEQVRLALEADNIEARPIWKPMHLQPVFQTCRIRGGAVSERLFRLGLCLPSGTAMSSSDMERVVDIIRKCAGKGDGHRHAGMPAQRKIAANN